MMLSRYGTSSAIKIFQRKLLSRCALGALVERLPHHFQLRVLILHRGFHILVSHRFHHSGEIASLFQNASSVVVPAMSCLPQYSTKFSGRSALSRFAKMFAYRG
jgi:hypothetical protein